MLACPLLAGLRNGCLQDLQRQTCRFRAHFVLWVGCFCSRSSTVAVVYTGLNTSGNFEPSHCSRCEALAEPLRKLRKNQRSPRLSTGSLTYPERKGGFCQEDHKNRARPSQRLGIQRKQVPTGTQERVPSAKNSNERSRETTRA